MMKSCPALLPLVFCLIYFSQVQAQDRHKPIPAPVSVNIDSYKSIQELPQPEWVIKEGDNPLSIHDILNGDIKDGQVLTINPDEIIIEQFEKYWFAIEFISEVDLHNWLLHVKNTGSGFGWSNNFSEIQSFGVQDGSLISSGFTGYFVPASKRDLNSRHTQSLLNLSLSSQSTLTLWVHISKNYFITSSFPQFTIYDPSVAFPDLDMAVDSLFWLGTFFIIWVLSLVIYLYLRDRSSIWFFIFITTLILDTLSNMSSDPLTRFFTRKIPESVLLLAGARPSYDDFSAPVCQGVYQSPIKKPKIGQGHVLRTQIHPSPTHPIRKNGFLGELTAGIAHEIQNPLNFVNNFSEVSAELMEELKKKEPRAEKRETRLWN
jgi:hypothetical protein